MTHLTAAYMAIGLITASNQMQVQEHWGGGQLELIEHLTHYADYCDALSNAAYDSLGYCPGCMVYEVAEPFGEWYGQAMLLCPSGEGVLPDHKECCIKLSQLMYAFYNQRSSGALSETAAIKLAGALTAVSDPEAP